MNTTLHILNGDGMLAGFEEAGIAGDVLIWRESLSEGPLTTNIESANFWQKRSDWICSTFSETPENYQAGMITELEKLNLPYEEINLWFEFDLHCQINLLGAMMLLERQTNLSPPDVYLISPAAVPGVDDFRGMGELNGAQLDSLYDNVRVQLNEYDFKLATEAWQLYVIADAGNLHDWISSVPFWGNMPNLKPALEAHIKRLEYDAKGFNYIHQTLISKYQSGLTNKSELYNSFWQTEKIYGMGDSQLDLYMQDLTNRGFFNNN